MMGKVFVKMPFKQPIKPYVMKIKNNLMFKKNNASLYIK